MTKVIGERQTADVRIKMRASDKAAFIAGAAADGYAQVSAWFRRLAQDRLATLRHEGKLGPAHGTRAPTKIKWLSH